MKNLSEYLIDYKFENYLEQDLKMLLFCESISNVFILESLSLPFIFEAKNIFDNYEIILDLVVKNFKKLNKDFENGKELR